MENYKIIDKIGEGTYGRVWRAVDLRSGEFVAVKRIKQKYSSWEECLNLREVKSLLTLKHPNIVKIREIVRQYEILYFVFEYMQSDLTELIRTRGRRFTEEEIKILCFQVFRGLAFIHSSGYFHRDLKPENLLVTGDEIKIADLGMAREMLSSPPYTEYVMSRWYRAPEVLLRSKNYDFKVDMWAMGLIMAEMFAFRRLFPGRTDADQIHRYCSVIGTPTANSWLQGISLARDLKFEFKEFGAHNRISLLLPSASKEAIDLIQRLCSWDPAKRPTVVDVLRHPFFESFYKPHIRNSSMSLNRRGSYNTYSISEELSHQFSCLGLQCVASNADLLKGGCTEVCNYEADVGIGAPKVGHYWKPIDQKEELLTPHNRFLQFLSDYSKSKNIQAGVYNHVNVRVGPMKDWFNSDLDPDPNPNTKDDRGVPKVENKVLSIGETKPDPLDDYLMMFWENEDAADNGKR